MFQFDRRAKHVFWSSLRTTKSFGHNHGMILPTNFSLRFKSTRTLKSNVKLWFLETTFLEKGKDTSYSQVLRTRSAHSDFGQDFWRQIRRPSGAGRGISEVGVGGGAVNTVLYGIYLS